MQEGTGGGNIKDIIIIFGMRLRLGRGDCRFVQGGGYASC